MRLPPWWRIPLYIVKVIVNNGLVKFRGVAEKSLEVGCVAGRRISEIHQKNSRQIISTEDAMFYEIPAENNRRGTCIERELRSFK